MFNALWLTLVYASHANTQNFTTNLGLNFHDGWVVGWFTDCFMLTRGRHGYQSFSLNWPSEITLASEKHEVRRCVEMFGPCGRLAGKHCPRLTFDLVGGACRIM